MTAYELAEKAEGLAYEIPADWSSGEPKNLATDIADMLRQQADRIAELEKQGFTFTEDGKFIPPKDYVAQAQIKPLSNDEINEIAMYCSDMNEYGHSKLDEFAFARAIEERHGIK